MTELQATAPVYRDGDFVVPFSMQLMSGPYDEGVRDVDTAREAISFLFNLAMPDVQVEQGADGGEWLAPLDVQAARQVLSGLDVEMTDEFSGYSVFVPGCRG